MMPSTSMLRLLLAASLATLCQSIDLELNTITCDGGLPIYAIENGIKMTCGSESRCTFGQNARITGTLYYENVDKVNLTNYMAYASANLDLVTLNYHLFRDAPVNLCGEWVSNTQYNWNQCPQNGTYHFAMNYTLPSGQGVATWFATGWAGAATFTLYAGESTVDAEGVITNTNEKLANCALTFHTYTTSQSGSALKNVPSAATATIAIIVAIAALTCLICLCACTPRIRRRRLRRAKAAPVQPVTQEPKEDPASEFYRMEEQLDKD